MHRYLYRKILLVLGLLLHVRRHKHIVITLAMEAVPMHR